MWKTILRRLLMMIPQIIILSVIAFLVAKMMPGDPFTGMIDPKLGIMIQSIFSISVGLVIYCKVILVKVSYLNNLLLM